ncbi:hypothetical protein CDAR_127461 [Caerostris darwini]|uniref:Uncharacterized protein n=1 Tax=Caerostris darwini TaxID=1538125 RepID=A0AAV4UW70_9ARAC|nr:hypothetical protein CDAR_127461 [Caerostris darwini]
MPLLKPLHRQSGGRPSGAEESHQATNGSEGVEGGGVGKYTPFLPEYGKVQGYKDAHFLVCAEKRIGTYFSFFGRCLFWSGSRSVPVCSDICSLGKSISSRILGRLMGWFNPPTHSPTSKKTDCFERRKHSNPLSRSVHSKVQ